MIKLKWLAETVDSVELFFAIMVLIVEQASENC